MLRNRKGHLYKRIIRKLFAVIVLLIGLRLVWVAAVNGWTSGVSGGGVELETKNAVKFVHRGGESENSQHFKFSKLKNKHSNDKSKAFKVQNVVNNDKKDLVNNVEDAKSKGQLKNNDDEVTNKAFNQNHNKHYEHNGSVLNEMKAKAEKNNERTHKVSDVHQDNNFTSQNTSSHFKPGIHAVNKTVVTSSSNDKIKNHISNVKETSRKTNDLVVNETEKAVPSSYNRTKEVMDKSKIVMKIKAPEKNLHQDNDKDNSANKNAIKDDNVLKEAVANGKCKKVDKWGENYNADISTYDLFQNVSYKMNSDGNYPIPVKTVDEVRKTKNLKHLNVILVPFSHADPGYGLTIEQYYEQMTHATLNNMLAKLVEYPNMTFQWAETVFLARWFEDLDKNGKETVKKLISKGQLEIVLGGWVMPDEASTNYIAVVDQLIEGHQWLIENLGVKPKSAWVNDPFGYSSTMPYLWKSTGMDNLLFLRINQPVKAKLMKMKSLEFMWRPYWKHSNDSDVLSSLMSYTNYWVSDVCGPNKVPCNEFNFLHLGEGEAIQVTEKNVAEQAKKIAEQFRITGDLYKHNTLYIGLGEDFSYPQPYHWDNMYTNYEKLITFINSQKAWNMTVKFGTLTEYFTQVRNEERKMAEISKSKTNKLLTFPTISGDFFPYTERNQEFWTGYFTTRPLNKRFSREIETLTRAADIFNVIAFSLFKHYGVKYRAYGDIAKHLRAARRELGMFMHHDGITGTSLPHVVEDYERRLFTANEDAHNAFKMAVLTLLSKGKQFNPKLLLEETVKPASKKMAGKIIFDTNKDAKMVLINPLARRRKEIINIFVQSKDVVISSPTKKNIPYQITSSLNNATGNEPFLLSFETELPALGIEVYTLTVERGAAEKLAVDERIPSENEDVIEIENLHLKVEFDKKTGMMKRILHKNNGKITNITAQFMVYQSKTSGAYIFGPSGPAQAFMVGEKKVTVKKGPLYSEVKVTSLGFLLSFRLYNASGIQGLGVHVKTEVDMAAVNMKEMEVILRFNTDVKNGDNFYTDQNGFQLIGRINRPNDKIESNYYPITTMALFEDIYKRVTLHSKQPHGGACLKSGQFEVMLDRHTFRDDKRGLGQGVYDNVRVNSDFIIQIEHKTHPFTADEFRYTYASEDSILLNDMLQNNVIMYNIQDTESKLMTKVHPLKSAELPCDVSIVGFRNLVKNNLEYNSTSLVLHRKPIHCGYASLNDNCADSEKKLTIKKLFPKLKAKISETSLSHLYIKQEMTSTSDITPDVHELRSFKVDI